jgi:hypothetical protein
LQKINIVHLGPSEFFDRKSDIIYGLYHALRSIGFDTSITQNQFNGESLNLLIGSDVIAGDYNAVSQLFSSQIDYAIYEVENYNGKTVNYRTQFNLLNYNRLLTNAQMIITPYLYNIPYLRDVAGKGKVVYAKWGFHENMIRSDIQRTDQHENDALFIGLIKGDRQKKLTDLMHHGSTKVRILQASDPFTMRDYAVANSKFGLSLSYGNTDDFVNPFRLYYMASNGMHVIGDHSKDDDGYMNMCERVSFDQINSRIQGPSPNQNDIVEKCRLNDLAHNLRSVF